MVYLKVEGELERVEAGLPWLEGLLTFLASLGRREVDDVVDVGDMEESTPSPAVPGSGRLNANFVPATSLWARKWWFLGILDT